MLIAVLIPCLNEQAAIAGVVSGFRQALPGATVFVADNNSTDSTVAVARAAGAVVRHEQQQGKGHVVRRMFSDVEADIYVLVDGDGTYDPTAAPAMIGMLAERQLDMVTGARIGAGTHRPGHLFGNRLLTGLVRRIFGDRISDMLSGYRVFSRRFVKSFPALVSGFETETEFTVHALRLGMPISEVPTQYRERRPASVSKLRTMRDGWRILGTILLLLKDEKPALAFGVSGLGLVLLGIALGTPVVLTYLDTGLVLRFPTAILATGIELLAFLLFACGLILDSVARGRKEAKRLAYLAIKGPVVPAQAGPGQAGSASPIFGSDTT